MKIEIWDGGLQEQELEAIKKIRAAFSDDEPDNKPQVMGGLEHSQHGGKSNEHSVFCE
ncbi:hypothetical protein ACV1DG_21755 [Aeromonas hydrophila]|uniref:hypothetical protein n=1 Tax=Gammaproteobacteria TaxID=1236 RepID=UPI00140259AC|nr:MULTISPECIES: hypothetical protein [Gammaproteobacteria]HDT5863903.1 hypothetical protein [Aeromonas hydrophila subsp. hydrophila]HDT5895109.1 hypothetical protein [Aeromonas hydrophila subsp. hydrophila]